MTTTGPLAESSLAATDPGRDTVDLRVSIVICTRDRIGQLRDAVESVLESAIEGSELIIVDQSAGGGAAPPSWLTDPRIRWLPSTTTGLSRARNIGLGAAGAEIVLMTDDDCTVDRGWVRDMLSVFTLHPTAGAVFGVVEPAPCDDTVGFVPAGPIERSRLIRSARAYQPGEGIGACSGFRRSAVLAVGGFDELLGAGARFRSGEEVDMALRLLLAGSHVAVSTLPTVTHHGFRTYGEARSLIRGYMYGSAAALAKLLRARSAVVAVVLVRVIWVSLAPPIRSSLAARRLPPIAGRVSHLARGFVAGMRHPIDRSTATFIGDDARSIGDDADEPAGEA